MNDFWLSVKDFQRQRVYDAEAVVERALDFAARGASTIVLHNSTLVLPQEVRFGDLPAAQRYVDQVMSTDWYRNGPYNQQPVTVVKRKGDAMAHYTPGTSTIHLPQPRNAAHWASRELILLHELAHHNAFDHHGPRFAATHLSLVRQAMGEEVGMLLWDAYLSGGVKISKRASD